MFLSILPIIVAFISTILGIFGKSWDDSKKGWQRLTLKGWLVMILAAGSFSVAALQTRNAYQAKQQQVKRDQIIRTIASGDVNDALNELLSPFKLVLDQKGGTEFADPINQYLYRATDRLSVIGSESFLNILDKVKALDCPHEFGQVGCSWADGFVRAALRGDEGLRDAASRYAGVLTPAVLALVQSVRDHKMLGIMRSMSGNIEINLKMGNTDIENVTVGWLIRGPHQPSDYYIPFFVLLQKIEEDLAIKKEEPDKSWVRKPSS